MTCPMPPELLEQLGLQPRSDTGPRWPEDDDVLGWRRRVATNGELEALDDRDQQMVEEVTRDRRRGSAV
jgi:hypothetical protein